MEEIAFYANISKQSLYNWMESDEKFRERLDELRASPVLKARTTMVEALDKPEHAKWYLERKSKREFAERQEHTGKEGEAINLNLAKLDDSQLDQLIAGKQAGLSRPLVGETEKVEGEPS